MNSYVHVQDKSIERIVYIRVRIYIFEIQILKYYIFYVNNITMIINVIYNR